MRQLLITFLLSLVIFSTNTVAIPQPLAADQAFHLTAKVESTETAILHWQIAPGYHLYRERIAVDLTPQSVGKLLPPIYPAGIKKSDTVLGNYEVYEQHVELPITIKAAEGKNVTLTVHYQGCAESGFCYAPETQTLTLMMKVDNSTDATNNIDLPNTPIANLANNPSNSMLTMQQNLMQGSTWLTLLSFFGFGLLLAFTPCVFPLLPILSSIIVGQGKKINVHKAFYLSLTYVLGMAVAYTSAGLLAGLAGNYLQASLQNIWILTIFSGLFVLLALSLFGFYDLRLPHRWQTYFHHLSNKQNGGTYIGVAIMGFLSMLIVSPCVSAPLIAALSYLSESGNIWLSGSALFFMALGMGTPLLLIGTLGGKFLPQAGTWMHTVKSFFGILLLGVAIELLARVLPVAVSLVLWAVLLIITSICLGAFASARTRWRKIGKGLGIIVFSYGIILIMSATQGATSLLQPLRQLLNQSSIIQQHDVAVQKVTTFTELDQALLIAKQQNKPVVLDFFADWCIACKKMEKNIFLDPNIMMQLKKYVVVKVDLTANNSDSQMLQQYYKVLAPPSFIVLDKTGQVVRRAFGEMDKAMFSMLLKNS